MTRTTMAALTAALLLGAVGCANQPATAGPATPEQARGAAPNVVDVVATGHTLQMPDTLPSGWTTFRLHNETASTHFGLLDLLPEGKTVEDSIDEVVPVFQDAMDLIRAGDPEAGFAEFANLPAWSADIVYSGGPGLVGPGETAVTTVFLEPGTYAMECYVLTNGVFHTTHGMITGFEVVGEESGARQPRADVTVTLSSNGADEGSMEFDGDLRPGRQTIAVHFADQAVHGNVLGHDLHIARVEEDTDLEELGTWMNWITGLETPAPVTFLGGTHDMPAGSTAYVEVQLTPGTYVLVSEVDDPASKGLMQTITVP